MSISIILANAYVKKSMGIAVNGKPCYIPHRKGYYPNKQRKIIIVFNCGAQYGCTSLKKKLMSGPDLISQLIGVLMRFREE